MSILVHGARLLDCNGESDDSWVLTEGTTISAVGVGATWSDHLNGSGAGPVVIDAGGRTVTPGFVDMHVHGGAGFSFEEGVGGASAALAAHREHGTTRSLLSVVSSPIERLASLLPETAALCERDPLVLGVHLEGPFLSATRRGAHDLAALRAPSSTVVEQLLEMSEGWLRLLTLAPELADSEAVTSRLVEAGVVVAVGHTEADYAQTRAAFDAGATVLTHAFNAMPGIHHRDPGPVMAAFDDRRAVLEIVSDGHHVDPAVVRLAFRAAPGRVALVSDAMAATGAADGTYQLGSRSVTVTDGVASLTGSTTLAGSTLTLDQALRNAIAWGVDAVSAVTAVTSTPARALGLDGWLGQLRPGFAADLVVLDADWRVDEVVAAGRPHPNR